MRARSLVLVLSLVALLVPVSQAAPPSRTAATTLVYLPSLRHGPPPVRVEDVYQHLSCPPDVYKEPCTYWVTGIVRNITTTPLYSVTLRLDIDAEFNLIENPPEPEDELHTARPVFGALFPDDPVRFVKSYPVGGFSSFFSGINHVAVSPGGWSLVPLDGRTYHQLTVVDWAYTDEERLTRGTVRNDTGRTIREARVVVTGPGCEWVEASPANTVLAPGETFAFTAANNVFMLCYPSRIIAQGAAD